VLSANPTRFIRLSIRLVPGPPRPGHFVYGGDQTYEQALATRTALLAEQRGAGW